MSGAEDGVLLATDNVLNDDRLHRQPDSLSNHRENIGVARDAHVRERQLELQARHLIAQVPLLHLRADLAAGGHALQDLEQLAIEQ